MLNRLGMVTGYSDNSFQPEKERSRGAAAKIIVSLLRGSDSLRAGPLTSPVLDGISGCLTA
ncbi:MAG: hypothetical protein HFF84_04635 [Oscillibacter sp.]|nr:hypothetical protein [Oscillibacter sp.]